jgi:hypothetical protein
MTADLDTRVREAAPIADAEVGRLTLEAAEHHLRDAILANPRAADARQPVRRRFAGRRWPVAGLGVTGAAITLVLLLAGGDGGIGPTPQRAWAAPALKVANAVPRLLIGLPGWSVTRADEFRVDDGEMTFSDGTRSFDLRWISVSQLQDKLRDRASSADRLDDVEVLGTPATVFRYRGAVDDFTAIFKSGRYALEFRTAKDRERLDAQGFARVLASLKVVGVDEWLGAMPPSVVLPAKSDEAVRAMLEGVPLPDGFDAGRLADEAAVRDRYQLGAKVSGAVACAWLKQWVDARRAGDTDAERAAEKAMATSHNWPVLLEMASAGGYPDVLWEFADAMNGDGTVVGGTVLTVEESYPSALGCEG